MPQLYMTKANQVATGTEVGSLCWFTCVYNFAVYSINIYDGVAQFMGKFYKKKE